MPCVLYVLFRVYDPKRNSFPDTVKDELISTMQLAFSVSREAATTLFRELMFCFERGYDHISVYSYGSQTDGTAEIDVKILSALLRFHSDSALEQFKLTVTWNRPDLADSQIFSINKVSKQFRWIFGFFYQDWGCLKHLF